MNIQLDNIPKACIDLYRKIQQGIEVIPETIVDDNAKYVSNEVEINIDAPIEEVYYSLRNTPLELQLPPVQATIPLNNKAYQDEGYRRIVCLKDGNSAIEEMTTCIPNKYFSYKVWNYTLKAAKIIEYARGEWWFAPFKNSTHVKWRYSFVLKNKGIGKLGALGRLLFKQYFIKAQYNELMVHALHGLKSRVESKNKL